MAKTEIEKVRDEGQVEGMMAALRAVHHVLDGTGRLSGPGVH